MGAVAIRPPREDLYRDLGVERDATAEQLNAAFRRRAKLLHPDAAPNVAAADGAVTIAEPGSGPPGSVGPGSAEPGSQEAFKRLSRAYAVLRDPERRAAYDAGLGFFHPPASDARSTLHPTSYPASTMGPTAAPAPDRHWQLGVGGARWAVGGGVALIVVGLLAAMWVMSLQRHDAALRSDGVPATATVVAVGGERRLEFTTRAGDVIRAKESTKTGTEAPAVGTEVEIRYDRRNPGHVVVDASHAARDITLWIVAVKLVLGGALLVFFGARRLRA